MGEKITGEVKFFRVGSELLPFRGQGERMAIMIDKDFDEILGNATKAIDSEYFLLPRKEYSPIPLERV